MFDVSFELPYASVIGLFQAPCIISAGIAVGEPVKLALTNLTRLLKVSRAHQSAAVPAIQPLIERAKPVIGADRQLGVVQVFIIHAAK